MIPTMLTRSLNHWRYWLAGSTSQAVWRRRKLPNRPAGFFRPQLLALEDRCLLSTSSTPLMEAFSVHRAASGISTAQLLDSATTTPVFQSPGSHVLVILAEGMPTIPICVQGTLYPTAAPGDYTLVITVSPNQAEGTPTTQSPVHDFIVVFATATTTTIEPRTITIVVASMSQNPITASVVIMAPRQDSVASLSVGYVVSVTMSGSVNTIAIATQVPTPPASATSPTPPPTLPPPLNPSAPPAPTRPISGVPTGLPPEQNRGISWWSQTPHPSQGPVIVLAVPYGTLTSVPTAQASTPVFRNLPAQRCIPHNRHPHCSP